MEYFEEETSTFICDEVIDTELISDDETPLENVPETENILAGQAEASGVDEPQVLTDNLDFTIAVLTNGKLFVLDTGSETGTCSFCNKSYSTINRGSNLTKHLVNPSIPNVI